MPAILYTEIDGLSLKPGLKENRDGSSYSAYFENPSAKIQLGNMDGNDNFEPMAIHDLMRGDGGQMGIRLEVLEKPVRRWLKQFEVDLIFQAKEAFSQFFDRAFDTHEVQEKYQSMFQHRCVEFRLSSKPNIYTFEDGKPVRIDMDHLQKEVLCIPIVQFIGLWVEDDLSFGLVAKVTDVMCFEGESEEDEEEEDGKKIFHAPAMPAQELRKTTYNAPLRPDSPVESFMHFGGGTLVGRRSEAMSLHPDDLKPVK